MATSNKTVEMLIDSNVADRLEVIGVQLDRWVFPRVLNGGIVVPSEPTIQSFPLGTEKRYDRERKQQPRQGAGQGQGTPRKPWPSWRSRSPSEAASVIVPDFRAQYAREAEELSGVYPGAQVWAQDNGLWLKVASALLPGPEPRAIFLICMQFAPFALVRSWGFWSDSTWIGPRHTNSPDGSICAFEPSEQTWVFGDPLVELVDLYSVWALRHLHLRVFHRWPGPQAGTWMYERILEFKDNELCGCGKFQDTTYAECCKKIDQEHLSISEAMRFNRIFMWGLRQPPLFIYKLLNQLIPVPPTELVFKQFNDVIMTPLPHRALPKKI